MTSADDDRYARNLGLLGANGQRRVHQIAVAIVGVGGLGSHVAQQLAYLGTRRFLLIDPDVIETSNLNRLIGSGPSDVGKCKVAVAEGLIRSTVPDAVVAVVPDSLAAEPAADALAGVHCVFGCVDNDTARLRLTELTSKLRIPYFDLASDAGEAAELTWFGGRLFVAIDGERCLSCAGELDQHTLARQAMTPSQREADQRIYGVDRAALDSSGPMVVSINGVVASLGVTEFVVWAAGLRPPKGHVIYRGDLGTVTTRVESRSTSCYYCDVLWRGQP
jgi:hypothetical protein